MFESLPPSSREEAQGDPFFSLREGMPRRTFLAASGAVLAKMADALRAVDQPKQSRSQISSVQHLPSPGDDIESIFRYLETAEDIQAFLEKMTSMEESVSVIKFLLHYRESPEEFQKNGWKGLCNVFGEFGSEWMERRGGIAHVVTVCHRDLTSFRSFLASLLKIGDVCRRNHQFAVSRMHSGPLFIVDNQWVGFWKGTLREYILRRYPERVLIPYGGIMRWHRVRDNLFAKACQHLLSENIEEEDMEACDLPRRDAAPMPVA